MTPLVALRWILRESRGARGRLLFLAACLAVGVAAVVGTAALSAAVREGYRQRSREILGADLTVDARGPLPRALDDVLAGVPGVERTDVTETTSMLRAAGGGRPARVARIHAVRGRFPLHGELVTEPPGGLAAHLAPDTVVVPPDVLESAGVRVGDEIVVGGGRFRVAAVTVREPPSFGFSALLGPRVFVDDEGLRRTQIPGFGTRVTHRAYVRLPAGSGDADLEALARRIESIPGEAHLDVDPHTEVGPGQGRTVARLESFLGLAALLSLVVGGVGVAQIVRAWIAGRTQAVAVLRCLGLRPAEILAISLGHVALLAFAGSAAGAAAGLALPVVADAIVPDLVPGGLPFVLPLGAVLRGVTLGVGVAFVFSVAPLTAIWRVPPARVLRSDAAPLPAPRSVALVSALVLVGGVAAAAFAQSPQPGWAIVFVAGLAALVAALWAAARVAVAAVRRLPRERFHRFVAHGLRALARPGSGTAASAVALGLGTMVVTSVWIVQDRFREGLLAQVPPTAPSVYLVDVRPEQVASVREALAAAGAAHEDVVPVTTARITAIDGRDVGRAEGPDDRRARRLAREHRVASRATLPPDNRIVAGTLWSDPARAEISVEERYAADLGLRIGSRVTLDVRGSPAEVVVTSLRRVEWQSLAMNFFFVAEPGVLDVSDALHLVSARVPAGGEAALQERIAAAHPNVTVVRVGAIVEQVEDLVGRVAAGVGALGAFVAAAGVLVLAGASSAGSLRRRGEVALLKVLGVTRGGVTVLLAVENAAVGALAGLLGSLGAVALAGGFLAVAADLDLGPPLAAVPVATIAAAVASAVFGVAASAPALRARPAEVLR